MKFGAITALSLASVFASSAVATASPLAHASAKSNLVVQGTVTVLTPSSGTPTSLTIQPVNPARPTENILLGASTVFRQGGATVTIAALVVGVPVQIRLTGSPATAAIVRIMSPKPVFVGGTVTALTPSSGAPTSITVQPRDLRKPTVNIALGAGTLYYAAGVSTTVTSLSVGVQVELRATGTPAMATVVEVEAPHPITVSGVVTTLTPSSGAATSVTVLPSSRHAVAVSIALGATTVYTQAGATVTVADLLVGSRVRIEASGNPSTANTIRIAVPRPIEVSGVVTTLSPSSGAPLSFTVQPHNPSASAVSIALGATTIYRQAGATVTVADLLVGSTVHVVVSGTPATASTVRIAAPHLVTVSGLVTALAPSSGTPTSVTVQPVGRFKNPVVVDLAPATTYMQLRATVTVAALVVGSHVQLLAGGTPLSATVVHVSAPAGDITIGSVTAVTNSSMTVQPQANGSTPVTFSLSTSTMYFLGRRASNIASVNVGDIVRVAAAASAPTTAIFVTVRNAVIVGRVAGVSGNVILVTGLYGNVLTVNVTSSTKYRMGGKSSSLSALSRGHLISAMGPAMSGVTRSITADTVWIGRSHNDILRDSQIQHRDVDRRHHH